MSIESKSLSFNTSGSSSRIDSYDDYHSNKVKIYVKDLLKSRIFLGRYLERRLINASVGYRDIVVVSNAEVELKKDLLEVLQKLQSVFPSTHWIGITDSDVIRINSSSICLWTEIDNQPFGPFWFQVRSVKFRESEIIVTLKCIRHISDAFLELEPILAKPLCNQSKDNVVTESLSEAYSNIITTSKSALSVSNIKEFVTFIFAFIIALFTGSTAFVNFLGNFILALVREMSILVKHLTPCFLGSLDFLSKIVGGFYILVAMIFRPSRPPPNNQRAIRNFNFHNKRESSDNCFD